MRLLDGKYEIISQTALTDRQTVFEAAAPDGTPVRIVWYDLQPDQERAFESYRRLLRRLKRENLAAVHDVISRPGAHYAIWNTPQPGAVSAADPALLELLSSHGYRRDQADIRRSGRQTQVYGLAFDGSLAAGETAPTHLPPARPARERRRRISLPPQAWSWLATLALLSASLAAFTAGFRLRTNDRVAMVPNVVGQPLEEAIRLLEQAGFPARPTPSPSTLPVGTILHSDPPAGSQLRPGREIGLSYALPAGQLAATTVPRLVGRQFPDEVERTLEEAGLVLGSVARIHAPRPTGEVILQGMEAGRSIGRGQTLDLLISLGPEPRHTLLPDLTGLSLEDALFLAEVAGFTPDRILIDRFPGPSQQADRVLEQSLPPLLPAVIEGTALRLLVVEGSTAGTVARSVPDLVGMGLEQALAVGGEFTISVTELETLALPEGVVMQTPPPGAPDTGGALVLTVNYHPIAIPIPDITAIALTPGLRRIPYLWTIEPGIPDGLTAEVFARTADGEERLVNRRTVGGGDTFSGTWLTSRPGPVTFRLFLNDAFYAEQRVNP